MSGSGLSDDSVPSWWDTTTTEIQNVHNRYRFAIHQPHNRKNDIEHSYNFPISGYMDIVDRIRNQVRSIYHYQNVALRLNFAIGMALQTIEMGEIRYLFPFHNTYVFPLPETMQDLDRVLNKNRNLELVESILQNRTNSKWKLSEITNVRRSKPNFEISWWVLQRYSKYI